MHKAKGESERQRQGDGEREKVAGPDLQTLKPTELEYLNHNVLTKYTFICCCV